METASYLNQIVVFIRCVCVPLNVCRRRFDLARIRKKRFCFIYSLICVPALYRLRSICVFNAHYEFYLINICLRTNVTDCPSFQVSDI